LSTFVLDERLHTSFGDHHQGELALDNLQFRTSEPPPHPSRISLQQRLAKCTSGKTQTDQTCNPSTSVQDFEIVFRWIDCGEQKEKISDAIEYLTDKSAQYAAVLNPILPCKALFRIYTRSTNLAQRSNVRLILANISGASPSPAFRESMSDVLAAAQRVPETFPNCPLQSGCPRGQPRSPVSNSLIYLCESLFTCEHDVQERILDSLTRISKKPAFAEFLIAQDLDISGLLSRKSNPETHARIMHFLLPLLPTSPSLLPLGLPQTERCALARDFSARVQPSLLQSLVDRLLAPNLTLLAFAATLVGQSLTMSDKLVMALLSFAASASAPFVLAVLTFFVSGTQHEFCWQIREELEQASPPARIQP
jgi:hypothetical protein